MDEVEDPGPDLPVSIAAADFSPEGKTLITASLGGTLAEWDAETGQRRRPLLDPKGSRRRIPVWFASRTARRLSRRSSFAA